jgi:radical SAM superfamily enzyme YgiQ (UPF0313 family)
VRTLVDFLRFPAPLLGVSCYFNLLPLVLLALQEIKERDPQKLIVIGGPGPSAIPGPLLEAFPAIDIIVCAEGEETTRELLNRHGGRMADVKGIAFRSDGEVICTPARARIQNLDSLPRPAYHAVKLKDYTCVAIHTARGCPFDCRFCQVAPLWGRTTRNRSVEKVVEEIEMLYRQHGIDYVRVADDTLTQSHPELSPPVSGLLLLCERYL